MPLQDGRPPAGLSSWGGWPFPLSLGLLFGVFLGLGMCSSSGRASAGDPLVEIRGPESGPDLEPDHDHHLQAAGGGQVAEVEDRPPAELVPEEAGDAIAGF